MTTAFAKASMNTTVGASRNAFSFCASMTNTVAQADAAFSASAFILSILALCIFALSLISLRLSILAIIISIIILSAVIVLKKRIEAKTQIRRIPK